MLALTSGKHPLSLGSSSPPCRTCTCRARQFSLLLHPKPSLLISLLTGVELARECGLLLPLTPMRSSLSSLLSPLLNYFINKSKMWKGDYLPQWQKKKVPSHSNCCFSKDRNHRLALISDEDYTDLFHNPNHNFSHLKYFTPTLTLIEVNHALLFLK